MAQIPGTPHVESLLGDVMAISHELSSEIAAALFAVKKRSPDELAEYKKMVFQIYSMLEETTDEAHAEKRFAAAAGGATPANSNSNEVA